MTILLTRLMGFVLIIQVFQRHCFRLTVQMCMLCPCEHIYKQVDHYNDVIMSAMAFQFTSRMIVYSSVYSGEYQRKHQSSALLAFAMAIHRSSVNSSHKGSVTRKIFPFDDVIMSQGSNSYVIPYPSQVISRQGINMLRNS